MSKYDPIFLLIGIVCMVVFSFGFILEKIGLILIGMILTSGLIAFVVSLSAIHSHNNSILKNDILDASELLRRKKNA